MHFLAGASQKLHCMQALKVDKAASWMTITLTCLVAFIKRLIISGSMDKVCIVFYGTVSGSPVPYKPYY